MSESNIIHCVNGHAFSKRRYGTICPYCNTETSTKEKEYTGLTDMEICLEKLSNQYADG